MLSTQETRRVAAELIERYGTITPASAMLMARDAEERDELVVMQRWLAIAREALRQLPEEDFAGRA